MRRYCRSPKACGSQRKEAWWRMQLFSERWKCYPEKIRSAPPGVVSDCFFPSLPMRRIATTDCADRRANERRGNCIGRYAFKASAGVASFLKIRIQIALGHPTGSAATGSGTWSVDRIGAQFHYNERVVPRCAMEGSSLQILPIDGSGGSNASRS